MSWWSDVTGAVGSTVANMFGTTTDWQWNRSAEKKAFDASRAQEQRIFERDSAYNSPAAQMQRLKDAGLNPNLMYGQGNVGNTEGKAVEARANQGTTDVLAKIMEGIMFSKQLELTDEQIANVRKQREVMDAQKTKLYEDAGVATQRFQTEGWRAQQMQVVLDQMKRVNPDIAKKLAADAGFAQLNLDYQEEYLQQRNAQQKFKVESEMKRVGLLDKDGKIKDEVLQGKQFMNDLLEVQKRFLVDGDLTPAQFWKIAFSIFSSGLNLVK